MVKRSLIILILISFAALNSFAQGISAKAETDTTDYLVGDYINYTITVTHDKNIRVFDPSVRDSIKQLSILKSEPAAEQEVNGKTVTVFKYVLSGYDSAKVLIPPVPVHYKAQGDTALRTVYTNPFNVTIHTLQVDTKKDIKDVKKPITIPLDWKIILLWALIILIVLFILFYLYRRYKRKKAAFIPEKKIIKLPPEVTAVNALKILEEEKLWQKGMIKEYHSRITEIIRRYFEERFKLPAMEMTTSEAMEQLRTRKETESIRDITYSFLSNADMVKFAKFTPMSSVNEEMMKQAYEIVRSTTPSAGAASKEVTEDAK